MKKNVTKKKEPKPEDFKTKKEAEEATEEYLKSQPIYNYFQFFIGGPNQIDRNKQEGKPHPPY